MKSERILTCIVCPRGCTLTVELDGGRVSSVKGNLCKRGEAYAYDECTAPKRTVTTTMRCESGEVVAVKTAGAVPKEKVFAVMEHINRTKAPSKVQIGEVLIENVADTGIAVIATSCK